MELLKNNISMCRSMKQEEFQITLDEDRNVPDVNPDVDRIIQNREYLIVHQSRTEKDRLFVSGEMKVSVLYIDDTMQRSMHRLDTTLEFEENFAVEGLNPGDQVNLRCVTEDLSITLINSRKLAIRAVITIVADRKEIREQSAAVEVKSDFSICEKRKKLEFLQLEVQNKDILRIREEFSIPAGYPNIEKIIWDHASFRGARISIQDEAVLVEGNLHLFVMYRAVDPEAGIQWLEQVFPFEGKIQCDSCKTKMIPDILAVLGQSEVTVREDGDGELTIFHFDGVLEIEMQIYKNEETEILEDAFSPERNLILSRETAFYESLAARNESMCKTSGKIRIQSAKPRILQICHISGSIRTDTVQIIDNGIQIEGAVPVSILYISSDDTMPFAMLEGTIPFSHFAEIPDVNENCRYQLTPGLNQLSASMTDSEEIEVKAAVDLTLFVTNLQQQTCICDMQEETFSMEQLERIPGVTAYFVKEEDSLWEIARSVLQKPEEIMEMNELKSEELKKGDCLVLMKSIIGNY